MIFEKIHIATPCHEKLSNMKPCSGGFYCGMCEKTVLDLRKKNAVEISLIAQSNEEACVFVHERHTIEPKKTYRLINRLEHFLIRKKLVRLSFIFVTFLVFLSSCHNRKPKHRMGGKGSGIYFKSSTQEEK